jgi:predicted acetyltransferase
MMAYQLVQFREREVPVAVLTASESVIYGRFGYGLASSHLSLEIATKRSGFRELPYLASPGGGRLRAVGRDQAAKILPSVHAEARLLRPGEIDRSGARWAGLLDDPEANRNGASARMFVVHEDATGKPDGYASYRFQDQPDGAWRSHRVVVVEDVYSLAPSLQAQLWRYLLDLDLIEELRCAARPVDDPLRWMLADPRQLRVTGAGDMLWARLVDVPAALSARGYATATQLVLEVGGTGGPPERYRLETGPEAADCRRAKAGEPTDLVLGLGDLASIYLGGCRPSVLAQAGRAQEARPGALARADAAFASRLAPFCGTHF